MNGLLGIVVTLIAVAVRLAWVRFVPTRPVGDFAMYVESARHLVERRSLDGEFIYMPGYVYLVAAVVAAGGGLFAIKMIGVAAGGLCAAAVYGTAKAIFGRAAAIAAGLACAFWPAGIAVSSVTGTDMPAAALLATAVWLLTRYAPDRPLGAPVLYGVVLGLAAYIRAVALPLAAFAILHFRARGAQWVHAVTRTVAATVVVFLILLPWGIRNRLVYGETFFTDSHGGHTALVGANPNSEGTYSRSLNRLFAEGTGHKLFVPPHRESDRVAYEIAKDWTRFSPKYALGLLAAKADRLLTHERPLLYWPLYRQSVLPEGSGVERFFARHRQALERLADGFWYGLIAFTLIGVVAAAARRNWGALSLLPIPLALTALYTLFFAEVRYHLAIAVLLMPYAGAGMIWLGEAMRDLVRFTIDRQRRPRLPLEAFGAAAAIALVFLGWPRLVAAGGRLRDRHRWAAFVCDAGDARRICKARAVEPPPGVAPSPVRGVWDGFSLALASAPIAAAVEMDLPAGHYRVSMRVELPVEVDPPPRVVIAAGEPPAPIAERAAVPGGATEITGVIDHPGGVLRLKIRAVAGAAPSPNGAEPQRNLFSSTGAVPKLWISAVGIVPDSSPPRR